MSVNFKRKNKLILTKENNNIDICISPNLIKYNNINDTNILKYKIQNFLFIMKCDCKNFNHNIFLLNFEKTMFDIEELNKNIIKGVNGMLLIGRINKLIIKSFLVTNHEFLHLASLLNLKQYKKFKPYYEGYTQLLSERYFNECNGMVYQFEVAIMRLIEIVIGKDYTETCFFNGNFIAIIDELKKYSDEEEINLLQSHIKSIYELEFFNEIEICKNYVQKVLNDISNILFSCLKKKIEQVNSIAEKEQILNDIKLNNYNVIKYGENHNFLTFELYDKKILNNFVKNSCDNNINKYKIFKQKNYILVNYKM